MKVKIEDLEAVGLFAEYIQDQDKFRIHCSEYSLTLTGNEIKMMASIRQHYVPWGH